MWLSHLAAILAILLSQLYGNEAQAQTVAMPVLSEASGQSYTQFSITVTDATTGATIYYTLDGTTPTASSVTVASVLTVSVTQS